MQSVLPHLRHDDSQVISEEGTELTVAGRGVAACVALTATVNVAVTTIETLPTNTITAAAVLWQLELLPLPTLDMNRKESYCYNTYRCSGQRTFSRFRHDSERVREQHEPPTQHTLKHT